MAENDARGARYALQAAVKGSHAIGLEPRLQSSARIPRACAPMALTGT